jgi:hypothetical protein
VSSEADSSQMHDDLRCGLQNFVAQRFVVGEIGLEFMDRVTSRNSALGK